MKNRLEEILQKHEDKKEFHFHEIDKITIIYPAVREYVKECVKASLEKASEKTSLIENETSYVKQSEINIEENIILL